MAKSVLCIPDAHASPKHNNNRFELLGQFIMDRRPDTIVCIGDFFDMESLCSYDKGKRSFEGRRYKADIEAGIDAMDAMFAPMVSYNLRQQINKKAQYRPKLVFTLGNHESVHEDTEVLTYNNEALKYEWVKASSLTMDSTIVTFAKDHSWVNAAPVALSTKPCVKWMKVTGDRHDELVSYNHRVYIDDTLKQYPEAGKVNQTRFTYSSTLTESAVDYSKYSDDTLRLLTQVVMDGCIYIASPTKQRVQFKLSKPRKIERLTALLDTMEIPYTLKEATKSGLNKLQPYYIRIYGAYAKAIITLLGGKKQIPSEFVELSRRQADIVLAEIHYTDGYKPYSQVKWTTTNKMDADIIQIMCMRSGIACYYKEVAKGSGFTHSKTQYHVSIATEISNRRYNTIEYFEDMGNVVSITTKTDTLITRRNGKIAYTGNSRIERVTQLNPELYGTIGYEDFKLAEYGWEVYPFLEPAIIEGIAFSHYFITGIMGRPISGENPATSMLGRMHMSCVQGHSHLRDFSERVTADGTRIQALVVGCYLDEDQTEDYAGQANKMWYKGVVMLNDVENGSFDPEFISIKTLKKMYANV